MRTEAHVGVFSAERTCAGALSIEGAGGLYVMREDVDDLFEVFRLLAAGQVAENQCFRLERTATGGIRLYRLGSMRPSLSVDPLDASDLIDLIAEMM